MEERKASLDESLKDIVVVYHPIYMEEYPTASVESPGRVEAIRKELEGKVCFVEPEPATEDDLLLVHSSSLISSVRGFSRVYPVALMAVGGAIKAARLAMEGKRTFGLIRPPGHHAGPQVFWGFCFFNNMAIAVQRLIKDGFVEKAFILDIDLHFGDGTDHVFSLNENVTVYNVQAESRKAFIDETEKALGIYSSPDVIAISAGFDRYVLDWGGTLETEDFQTIGAIVRRRADELCEGRCFALLEGGYYIPELGKNTLALLKGMATGIPA